MNADRPATPVGLSRRELERELAWQLRRIPTDPTELAKFVEQLVVTLIDKNNAALARHHADGETHATP